MQEPHRDMNFLLRWMPLVTLEAIVVGHLVHDYGHLYKSPYRAVEEG